MSTTATAAIHFKAAKRVKSLQELWQATTVTNDIGKEVQYDTLLALKSVRNYHPFHKLLCNIHKIELLYWNITKLLGRRIHILSLPFASIVRSSNGDFRSLRVSCQRNAWSRQRRRVQLIVFLWSCAVCCVTATAEHSTSLGLLDSQQAGGLTEYHSWKNWNSHFLQQ